MRFLSVEEVLGMHARLLAFSGGTPGILNLGAIDSALYRCKWGPYFGAPSLEQRASLLIRGLCQDHPFADGNKRAAFASACAFLADNGILLEAPPAEEIRLMLALAQDKLTLDEVAAWFLAHGRKVKQGGE